MKKSNIKQVMRIAIFVGCLCSGIYLTHQVKAASVTPSKAEQTDNANSWRYEAGKVKADTSKKSKSARSVIRPTNATAQGIDISYYNGTIDWQKAKNSLQVDFAIIRAGYGQDITSQDDSKWEEYTKNCVTYEIPYGAYLYSYADSVAKAKSEADHMIRLLNGKKLSFPIYYDMEDEGTQGKCTNAQLGEIATAFLSRMEEAGYTNLGVYANENWFSNKLTADVFSKYPRWVAQYNTTCTYTGSYHMWQYSEGESVPGISTAVDMNYKIGTWNSAILSPRVRLDKTTVTLTNGKSTSLVASILANDHTQSITWNTSNSLVASVSTSGVVKAKAPGKVTITAKLTNGTTATCAVTVKPKTNKIKKLKKSGSKSIKVTWSKVSGVSGYRIYMSKKKNSGYKRVKTISYKKSTYTKSGLKKKKRYYFKVRSYKTVGGTKIYSSYSSVKSLKR